MKLFKRETITESVTTQAAATGPPEHLAAMAAESRAAEPTIYESIGGEAAVSAAVDGFYERVWADPDLLDFFAATDREALKAHQRGFIAAALGGPNPYLGKSMADAHAGRGITSFAFDRVVEHLADTLAELGVPAATIGEIAGALAPLRSDIVTA